MTTHSRDHIARVRYILHIQRTVRHIAGWVVLLCVAMARPALAQSWTSVYAPFTNGSGQPILLTDGTILVQDLATSDFWKLTPDPFGDYSNGTWTQAASLPNGYGPLYNACAVLADGRVVIMGGEYNLGFPANTNEGAIYDPVADVWTPLAGPGWATIGSTSSCILPDGRMMLANPNTTQISLLDPASLTWASPPPPRNGNYGKADTNVAESWTLLPFGSILTVDSENGTNSEIYDPVYGYWYSAGGTVSPLSGGPAGQVPEGPVQVLLPNGTVVAFGATGFISVYNPIGTTVTSPSPGKWGRVGKFPVDPVYGQLVCADAPACLLPNGHVLVCASPEYAINPAYFYEFDGQRLNPEPSLNIYGDITPSFAVMMLMLPSGQVLASDFEPEVQLYTPIGGYNPAWAPAITSFPAVVATGNTYPIYGTQFNGVSQAGAYGDDCQTATNYPLVRVTMQATGHVVYYRTHDHSTMAVATGSNLVSTNFDVPALAELGAAELEVVTNGIPSLPVAVIVVPPPVANAQSDKIPHNKPASLTLTGNDPSGLPLTFLIDTYPTNGVLSNLNPNTGAVTYTPNTNYQGADSFTFSVSDGYITSVPATVSIIVVPAVPIANAQSVSDGHDAGVSITLTGSDPLDNPPPPLTFAIATNPTHGTLGSFDPVNGTVTYLPNADYQGTDTFTFTVNNGNVSKPATVTVKVAPAAPNAIPQVVPVAKNAPKSITLTGTDTDVPPLPLTFAIFSTPAHGTLSGLNAATGVVTYTPATNFAGDDSFQFTVSNGVYVSVRATVTLVVAPGTPIATPQTVSIAHNTPQSITLTGTDPDNPPLPLSFAIVTKPTHGALTGLNAATGVVTYTPTTNYQGADSFTFTCSNGVNTGLPAKVTLSVAPGTPTANAQTVNVSHNIPKAITLSGTDPDNPVLPLTYTIVTEPSHGTITGFNPFSPKISYTPAANYQGADSFTFTVSNGVNTSAPATINLIVAPGVPVAHAQSDTVTENASISITLTGTDPDNPALPLTFAIAANPLHGTLSNFSASAGTVTYKPAANYKGGDSFTFTVSNGVNKSAAAKVTLTVVTSGP